MQSSLPRCTRLVRSMMARLALAVLVTAGCQQGSDEPELTGSGAPPRPIAGSSTDERPNDVETPPAKPPAAETPAVIPNRPANAVEAAGNGKPAASAKADNLPTLDPPATSGAPQEKLPTPSAKAERPAEVTPQLSQAVPPASLHPPVVVLSAGHAETCRLKVGDKMPEVTLTDQQGTEQTVAGLLSDKLTVVLFWSMREALGREQFRRLQSETYDPFHQDGLNVIAVHVGDGADDARALYQEAQATFPCLLDTNKLAFTAVATENLPRTYLLDAQGQVLWMDIFYARSTRLELINAIHYHLLALKKQSGN